MEVNESNNNVQGDDVDAPAWVFGRPEATFTAMESFYVTKPFFSFGRLRRVFADDGDTESPSEPIMEVHTPTCTSLLTSYMTFTRQAVCERIHTSKKTVAKSMAANSSAEPLTTIVEKKYVFCTVYRNWLVGSFVLRFILEFQPDPFDVASKFSVVMFVHNYSSYADAMYKGTKVRWLGTAPLFAKSHTDAFNMVLLDDDEPSLHDDMDPSTKIPGGSLLSYGCVAMKQFLKGLIPTRQNDGTVDYVDGASPRYPAPFATLMKVTGTQSNGASLWDPPQPETKITVRLTGQNFEDTLVLLVLGLVLRQQELDHEIWGNTFLSSTPNTARSHESRTRFHWNWQRQNLTETEFFGFPLGNISWM